VSPLDSLPGLTRHRKAAEGSPAADPSAPNLSVNILVNRLAFIQPAVTTKFILTRAVQTKKKSGV